MKSNGAILYRGPSLLDGSPILVIVTGLVKPSENEKTGDMLQTWILPDAGMGPLAAAAAGKDAAVCGSCPLRPVMKGGCYVDLGKAPGGIYKAAMRGSYPEASGVEEGRGRLVRLGSYGDPAAVPIPVWRKLLMHAKGHTGYTHQWRDPRFAWWRFYCMASADSVADAEAAEAAGWRVYRVAAAGDSARRRGEAKCPASDEAGFRETCATCKFKCGGRTVRGPSVVIQAHGAGRKRIGG
jgi:hypothetical protein